MHRQKGFTLTELILVIIILGIIAAVALPKFAELGKEARIASLQSLAGALDTAANHTRLLCVTSRATSGCDLNARNWLGNIDNQYYWLSYGWPDSGDSLNNGQIDAMLIYSGFQATLPNYWSTRFELVGAPTPASCSVTYIDAWRIPAYPQNYTIQIDSSGC